MEWIKDKNGILEKIILSKEELMCSKVIAYCIRNNIEPWKINFCEIYKIIENIKNDKNL